MFHPPVTAAAIACSGRQSLGAGGRLTLFFIWRRDLVANMIGHWFVDFFGNVLPGLLS